MNTLELVLYVTGALAAVTGAVSAWIPRVPARRRLTADIAGLALLAASTVVRGIQTGHPPLFGTYENTLASAWALALAVAVMDRSGAASVLHRRLLGLWVPATLAYGLFFSREPLPLTISERSILIDIHVLLAWSAYTVLISGAMAALAHVLRPAEATPDLELAVKRGSGVGFALFTGLIVVGAIYSYQLFATPFNWELVLAACVATWLALGLVVHAWLLFGWSGRRLAWCLLLVAPLVLFSFWSWSLYTGTYHFFDIVPMKVF